MIEKTLSLAIPCRADEPGLGSTLDSLLAACRSPALPSACLREILICLNGVSADRPSPPLHAVREFCTRHAITLDEIDLASAQERSPHAAAGLRCVVLVAGWRGKPRAMNALWRWARGDLLAFCDADVRVAPDALARLYAQLQNDARARLVAAREVPVVDAQASLWSRIGALPYRFDFGNAGGRLFMIRTDALISPLPEDLLLEDAWLTVAVGKSHVRKHMQAQVFFVPPQTWNDYFAERVRTEAGKIQLRRQHAALLEHGPVAAYPWAEFVRRMTWPEYGLALVALAIRGLARLWAWGRLRRGGFYRLYRPFRSTKRWTG